MVRARVVVMVRVKIRVRVREVRINFRFRLHFRVRVHVSARMKFRVQVRLREERTGFCWFGTYPVHRPQPAFQERFFTVTDEKHGVPGVCTWVLKVRMKVYGGEVRVRVR